MVKLRLHPDDVDTISMHDYDGIIDTIKLMYDKGDRKRHPRGISVDGFDRIERIKERIKERGKHK